MANENLRVLTATAPHAHCCESPVSPRVCEEETGNVSRGTGSGRDMCTVSSFQGVKLRPRGGTWCTSIFLKFYYKTITLKFKNTLF